MARALKKRLAAKFDIIVKAKVSTARIVDINN
jgi:hypothetical protein